jgi:hypothetical protein
MSGHKRAIVTINQEEYERLREAELRLRELPDTNTEAFESALRQSSEAYQKHIDQVQRRQASFEAIVQGMDESIRGLEISTSRAILAYQDTMHAEMQNYAGSLWENFEQTLASNMAYFEATVAENHRQYQEAFTQQARRMRRIETDAERKRALAEDWLAAAEDLAQFIRQYYPHDLHAPGQVDRLDDQLEMARQNLDAGLSEAVVLTTQQLYTAYSELRVNLEAILNEWQFLYQSGWESIGHLQAQAQSSAYVCGLDLDGNPLPVDIDVDYWTQGRLNRFFDGLERVNALLETQAELLPLDELRRFIAEEVPAYQKALEDIVLDARVTALNSQLRINIADLVVQALQEQGFALDASHYQDEDMRMAFGARLTSLEGSSVIVQVDPVGEDLGENELNLRALDSQPRTEHEMVQRWNEINRSLAGYGLVVGPFSTVEPAQPVQYSDRPNRARAPRRGRYQQNNSGRSHGN